MPKSQSGAASPENKTYGETNGEGPYNGTSRPSSGPNAGEYNDLLEQAKVWVEENQTAAMLSGFGFGVFIGVLLRR